ncbi:hypothetical protein EDC02_5956 [Micromonospora sp. Llam0]|nr:hypothetical protein EDC02_5956 [Micromonospora sp. Llam0]
MTRYAYAGTSYVIEVADVESDEEHAALVARDGE